MGLTTARAALEEGYGAVRTSGSVLSVAEHVAAVKELQEIANLVEASKAWHLAHVAALETVSRDDTIESVHRGLGRQAVDAPELLAPCLGVSVQVAGNRLGDAIAMASRTPRLLDQMATGALDAPSSSPHGNPSELIEVGGFGAPGRSFLSRGWVTSSLASGTARMAPELTCAPTSGAALSGDVPQGLSRGRRSPSQGHQSASDDGAGERIGYRIPMAMRRLVHLRDGRCRFPGCTIALRFCDLDHVRPWPDGPTDPTNLISLADGTTVSNTAPRAGADHGVPSSSPMVASSGSTRSAGGTSPTRSTTSARQHLQQTRRSRRGG